VKRRWRRKLPENQHLSQTKPLTKIREGKKNQKRKRKRKNKRDGVLSRQIVARVKMNTKRDERWVQVTQEKLETGTAGVGGPADKRPLHIVSGRRL